MNLNLARFAIPLLTPKRHNVLHGGRGSGKSTSIADVFLYFAMKERCKILCAREFQNSMSDSVLSLLEERAHVLNVQKYFTFQANSITSYCGAEFIFKGIRHNINSIKSIPGIKYAWIEEAQTISQASLDVLIPTVRLPDSAVFYTYNPENEDDPVHAKFVPQKGLPPDDAYIAKVNWYDNPWFPEVLKKEKDELYDKNPDLADHIWGGECRSHSDAQIFKNKFKMDDFEIQPHWQGPYYGIDWGFSVDPLAAVELWIDLHEEVLYVRREVYGTDISLDKIPTKLEIFPNIRRKIIRADNSRPETINHIASKGFQIIKAEKWSGSVEDGIDWLKSKFRKIIIHSECPSTYKEFKNYSYKVDRLTGQVTTDIVDAWNHAIDAIRYGLDPLIRNQANLFEHL